MSSDLRPFKISIPDSSIDSLKAKLASATFPDEVSFSNDWNYGAPLHDVQRLAKYWRDGFDWRAQEEKLNKIPQFVTTISVEGFRDLDIHFVHQRSTRPGSIPLLFCHGCECSFALSSSQQLLLLRHSKMANMLF